MGETTIGWTATVHNGQVYPGYTFNPWIGCTKVSPGCAHCYAERDNNFHKWVNGWGPSAPRKRTSESNWKNPLKWDKAARLSGIRRKVFCASLADVFEDRPELVEWRSELFDLIEQCENLDWLLLTKRPENVMMMTGTGYMHPANWEAWKHIWIGTTAENQAMADKRIPELLKIPAAIRFVSVEPMLGPVSLMMGLPIVTSDIDGTVYKPVGGPFIDWVINGFESGPGSRIPLNRDELALNLLSQCQIAGVPYFYKQNGGPARIDGHWGGDLLAGQRYQQFPE